MTPPLQSNHIRLLVRGDDMGSCHAANEACLRCYREGILRSVEVMVPAPWYPEAVRMLREHPGLDTPEMRALWHPGYERVAQERAAVTEAFTSQRVQQRIQERGIHLVSYADLYRVE